MPSAISVFRDLIPGFTGPFEILWWALLGLKLIALADAAIRPRTVFIAADKLTKPGWVLILATFTLSHIFQNVLSFFGLIGIVAAAVYLVDARPALRHAAGKGRGGWGGIRRRRGPRPL
jgi:hypothetical protein